VTCPDGLHSPASKINGNVRGQKPGSAPAFQKSIRRVAVIGSGLTGASWATYYLAHGFDVVAADPAFNTADNLRRYVDRALGAVSGLENQTRAPRDSLRLTPNIDEALLRADFVQECSDDGPNSKINLLAEIDKRTRPDSIIASNASGGRCQISRSLRHCAYTRPAAHLPPDPYHQHAGNGGGGDQASHVVLWKQRKAVDLCPRGDRREIHRLPAGHVP
jgi:hypothetical protein